MPNLPCEIPELHLFPGFIFPYAAKDDMVLILSPDQKGLSDPSPAIDGQQFGFFGP